MGIQRLILESDAKTLVDNVNATEPDDSCRGQLVADIQFSLNFFPSWQMVYAPRQVNQVAHALAQRAIHGNMDDVWWSDPPVCIRSIVEVERVVLIPLI